MAEREAILKRRLDDRLNDTLREARAEVDRVVGTPQAARPGPGQRRGGALLASPTVDRRRRVAQVRRAHRPRRDWRDRLQESATPGASDLAFDEPPAAGEAVFVATFGASGIVRGVSGQHVDVDVRGKRMRVKLADLRRPDKREAVEPVKKGR